MPHSLSKMGTYRSKRAAVEFVPPEVKSYGIDVDRQQNLLYETRQAEQDYYAEQQQDLRSGITNFFGILQSTPNLSDSS